MSFEKLLMIGVIAAVILGPAKLPLYASKLAALTKSVRAFADRAQARIQEEVGAEVELDWRKYDPRQYDPRRIVRDAFTSEFSGLDPAETPLDVPDLIESVRENIDERSM